MDTKHSCGVFFSLASIIEEAESCKECQKEVVLRFGPFLFCPTYYWNILQCYSFDWVKREQPLDRLLFGSRLTGDWQDVVALRYYSPLYFYSSSKKMKKKVDDRSCKDNFSWLQSWFSEANQFWLFFGVKWMLVGISWLTRVCSRFSYHLISIFFTSRGEKKKK